MKQILLIEPDPDIMRTNVSWLRMHRYDVLQAFSLAEAEDLLLDFNPNAIVMETVLPDGDGLDFCRRFKECCKTPLLILSKLRESNDIVTWLHAGADDYITKPYDLGVLTARIEVKSREIAMRSKEDYS